MLSVARHFRRQPASRLVALIFALLFALSCGPSPIRDTESRSPTRPEAAVAAATSQAGRAASGPTAPPSDAPYAFTEPAAGPPSTTAASPFAGARAFDAQAALRDLDVLTVTIGSRVAGSDAQAKAANFLAAQLEAAGLAVTRQPFTFRSYEDRGSGLALVAQADRVEASALRLAAAGSVEGELVSVGLAREGDFDPALVSGKVALAQRGEVLFSAKVANLEAAGAQAVVVYNNQPGRVAGSLTTPSRVPVVSISAEDGERLLARLASGPLTVRVMVDAAMADLSAQNVVASLPGGPRRVVIGAHFDSVAAGPGANDNGSGTVTVVELARVAASRHYPFTLDFVLFDAEEVGLIGSARYVERLDPAARQTILAMINLDMVGVGDRLTLSGDAALLDVATQAAARRPETAGSMRRGQTSASDHASFTAAGIPALFINRPDDPRYHTTDDRIDFVEAGHLASAGQIVLDTLDALARAQTGQ